MTRIPTDAGTYAKGWVETVKQMMKMAEEMESAVENAKPTTNFHQEYPNPSTLVYGASTTGGILSSGSMTAAASAPPVWNPPKMVKATVRRAPPPAQVICPLGHAHPVLETKCASYDRYYECDGKVVPLEYATDVPF